MRIKVLPIQFLVRVLFLAFGQSPFHCVLTWQRESERELEYCLVSLLTRRLIPSHGPILITPSKPHYLPKASSQISLHWGVKALTYEFATQAGTYSFGEGVLGVLALGSQ